MILVTSILAFGLVGVVALFLLSSSRERDEWRAERRELITRALHPQVIPTAELPEFEDAPPEPDGWDLVGVSDGSPPE